MELFGMIGWISVPNYILQFIDLPAESLRELIANKFLYWWITLGVGGGLYLIGLIFGGIGLMTLAKRAGIKHGWMGFFPFANTYLTGKLAGETTIFNARVKRIGLWAMICEIVFVLINIFMVVTNMLVLDVSYYTETVQTSGRIVYSLAKELMPENMQWIYTLMNIYVLDIIDYVYSLVILFLFCTLFFAFYRKYYVRSPFMLTFLSAVLPGRGFAIFAVRNNSPIDYNAYMRRRMEQYQQQQQQPPYGGGYYGPQGGAGQQNTPDPFGGEFGGTRGGGEPPAGSPPAAGSPPPSDDDPFSDF